MENLDPNFNSGALIRQPVGRDFVLGYNSPFVDMPDLENDWTPLHSVDMRQSRPGVFDTLGCTNYGYCSTVEPQINRMIKNGTINSDFLSFLRANGYLNSEGNVVFSRSALGFMSGLTPNGNYLDLVANAGRTKGLIPESLWPSDPAGFNSQSEWLRPVPQNLLNLAAEFQKYIDLPYHVLDAGQQASGITVKKAPLYVALCTCGGWQTDTPVNWCNATSTNHSVSEYKNIDPQPTIIQDSYPSFQKQLSLDYQIPYLIQVFAIQKKNIEPMYGFKTASSPTVYIIEGGVFVPVTDWSVFVDMGGSTDTVFTLLESEFASKGKIAKVAKFNK